MMSAFILNNFGTSHSNVVLLLVVVI